jgi:hypothetical protein
MNITEGNSAAYTTEGAMFGINHSGNYTNWWAGSALISGWDPAGTNFNWSSDGIWYWVSTDGGAGAGDYLEKTGLGGTNGNTGWTQLAVGLRATYANNFKDPAPYSTLNGTVPAAGLPANASPFNAATLGAGYTNAWANVEMKTVKNLVTLSINKTVIFTYTNNTVWTNGTLMLGYEDPFSSVGGSDAAVYYSNVRVVRLAPPQITLQPTNLIVGAGSNATFAVAANFDSSSANTNGQWLLNGVAVAGATNATYSFTVGTTNYGTYSWTINDGNYSVTSSNATLRPPPFSIITQPPASTVVASGTATTLSVVANSFSGVTNYQWQFNGVNRAGTATNKYVFTAGPTNYGSFRVIVNDNWNFVTSSVAVVTPPTPSIVSVLPNPRAAVLGGSASFTVTANVFSGVTNYQWFSNSVNIAGATTKTVTLNNIQAGNFGSLYTVSVNDGTTSVTSAPPVTLTMAVSQLITSPALNGTKFTLSLNTEVGPSYVVQYKTNLLQSSWVPVSTNAGTGGIISVTNTIPSGGQAYYRILLQ